MIRTLIDRKITTLMLFLGICLMGIISIKKIPVQLLPNIDFPKLTIITSYPNAAPSEVEKLVTKKIEEAANSVNGVKSIYSESMEGLSIVTVTFNWNTDMDMALIETKEKADIMKNQLPQDTGKSIVMKYDPREEPVQIYTLTESESSDKSLRKKIEKEVIPYLERIDGVAMVDILGGNKEQINVDLDLAKIYSYQIGFNEIISALESSNFSFPAGYITKANKEFLVRTYGDFSSFNQIKNVVVTANDSSVPVYLEDISEISNNFKDKKSVIKYNGSESIALLIRKEPGKNIISVSENINAAMKNITEKFEGKYKFRKIFDKSLFIRNSVTNVLQSGILGCIIAVFVLVIFLKQARPVIIISILIPISILSTFSLMYFTGISINAMSLGGLALGIGMMVDGGIVVMESILAKSSATGISNENAHSGTMEVLAPLIASVFTTVIVFLPIIFISGLSGAIFKELALTISFSLLCSLFCSVTLIPMLFSLKIKKGKKRASKTAPGNTGRFYSTVSFFYSKFLKYALENKKLIILFSTLITLAGIGMFSLLDVELMPKVDQGEFSVEIKLPNGTSLQKSSEFSEYIEAFLLNNRYVNYVYTKIGSDPDDTLNEKMSGKKANEMTFKIKLTDKRRPNINTIINDMKKNLVQNETFSINFSIEEDLISSLFSTNQKPLTINIYGNSVNEIREIGNKLSADLKNIKSLHGVQSSFQEGSPEYAAQIDRDKMFSFGIGITDLAQTLKTALTGEVVTKLRINDEETDIRVRLQESNRTNIKNLDYIILKNSSDEVIPISNFVSFREESSQTKIIRIDQSRVNQIGADISGKSRPVFDKVNSIIKKTDCPESCEIKIAGTNDEIKTSVNDLKFAFLLSLVLIYMLLAAQFQSLIYPFFVMLSIPVAFFGISFSLLMTGSTLNINSGIGIIMLSGIVVNNAIILFDCIEKEKTMSKDLETAIINACMSRLKPILMTTLSTIMAMLPLAIGIGQGSELQKSMAIAVIGGLSLSTFITLIYIPSILYFYHDKKEH